jgi:hypothetical protein
VAKQCFVVQTHNKSVEVFDAETQDGRQNMLRWVEKQTGGLSPFEKTVASRIMEGDFSRFATSLTSGYNLPVLLFTGKGKSNREIHVVLGTFGEPT